MTLTTSNTIPVPNQSLPTYLFRNLDQFCDNPALIDGTTGNTLTFKALYEEVQSLAAGLASYGVSRGETAAIVCSNSIDFVVFYLAVTWAGAVLSPMSPLFSSSEIHTQILASNASYLMADEQSIEKGFAALEGTGINNLFSTKPGEKIVTLRSLATGKPFTPAQLDPLTDLAVLPFSSGTTGLPKGVRLTHANLITNLEQLSAVEPVTREDTFIGLLPFSHIYGLTVVLNLGLSNGATIVLLPFFKKDLLLKSMQRYRVTRAHFVPPIIRILAQSEDLEKYDLNSLGVIVSGAAPLDESTARQCARKLNCVVKQGYGLTESSPVTHISPDPPLPVKTVSVGPALPGTECRIIDPQDGRILPPGQSGEVLVRGPQVMQGYLNDAEATRATLTPDGWLHTGDIGYQDEEGYLFLVDRIKEMIKVKGYQVAPAEIEAVLMSHPDILDAAVIPTPDANAGEVPKAFVVSSHPLLPEDIIDHVAARLGPIKHVRRVEFVEKIPRSSSGKILRRVLIEQERAAPRNK